MCRPAALLAATSRFASIRLLVPGLAFQALLTGLTLPRLLADETGIPTILKLRAATAAETPPDSQDDKAESTGQQRLTPPAANRQVAPPARSEESDRRAREAARQRGQYTFDDLKFDIEPDAEFFPHLLTDEIRKLHQQPMEIRGYILPTSVFQQRGFTQFVLVRDNQECCFGPGAALYDCIMVQMKPGQTANFSTRPVMVKGRFEIDQETYQYPDGGHYAIYRLVAERVR
jgi:hypothetical protein